MQVDRTQLFVDSAQLFRVRALAEMWQVSPATVYRLVESGQLPALRFGKGKGALRVTGEAVNTYLTQAGTATTQAGALACVACGTELVMGKVAHALVGTSPTGASVFACIGECADQARASQVAGEVA